MCAEGQPLQYLINLNEPTDHGWLVYVEGLQHILVTHDDYLPNLEQELLKRWRQYPRVEGQEVN